ncbi:hypothetical protein Tco_0833823, partial [Tanacetum coccineum]
KNGKKSLALNFKTLVESTGLDYNQGTYVAHPSLEVAKAELAKIATTKALLIAYCLLIGTRVDIGEIIYSDLVTRLMAKYRQNYVSYPRFVFYALEVLLGLEYAHDEKFGSLPNILSPSKFTRDPSKVTPIELMASMVAVNNLESAVTPLPFLEMKKKKISLGQTTHPQDTKGNIRPAIKGFYSPLDEGTHKLKSLPEGKPTDAKDIGGNIQPTSMGLPFTPLDEGTSKSQPLPEGKTTDPKDSKGP